MGACYVLSGHPSGTIGGAAHRLWIPPSVYRQGRPRHILRGSQMARRLLNTKTEDNLKIVLAAWVGGGGEDGGNASHLSEF